MVVSIGFFGNLGVVGTILRDAVGRNLELCILVSVGKMGCAGQRRVRVSISQGGECWWRI